MSMKYMSGVSLGVLASALVYGVWDHFSSDTAGFVIFLSVIAALIFHGLWSDVGD